VLTAAVLAPPRALTAAALAPPRAVVAAPPRDWGKQMGWEVEEACSVGPTREGRCGKKQQGTKVIFLYRQLLLAPKLTKWLTGKENFLQWYIGAFLKLSTAKVHLL
jgi:hypothetical protein